MITGLSLKTFAIIVGLYNKNNIVETYQNYIPSRLLVNFGATSWNTAFWILPVVLSYLGTVNVTANNNLPRRITVFLQRSSKCDVQAS